MKAIKTKDTNITYAENQPEYIPLPCCKLPDGEVITCWEMTDEELENIIATKRIYLSQLTFNQKLQPINVFAANPIIYYTPNKQTRLQSHDPKKHNGNCYATVISCIMGTTPEEVLQIQEYYEDENWRDLLNQWLAERGWELKQIDGHLDNDDIYFVKGGSPRHESKVHICLYQQGELLHDPHPSNDGILSTLAFEILKRV